MTEKNRLHMQLGALISALDILAPTDRARIVAELQRKAARATDPLQSGAISRVARAVMALDE
ncbi:MAG: hypothetical protein Q8M07_01060 [Prosthecobacter sp.]|nr:hypothetical protein [Prosthecobacter sp.]